MSRLRTLTTGLTALTGLALIIAGTPFLLVALAGNPLPDSVPTINAIGNALARLGGDATILLGLLKYAAWAAWAWFTISAITQTIAQLHQAVAGRKDRTGATLGSTPAARVPRAVDAAWIGRMVAAVLALFTILAVPNISLAAGPAGAATTPGPDTAAAPVATAGPQAGTGHELSARAAATGGREVTTTETTTVPRTVTIEKGDTLSEVSEEQYGTPGKWPAIFNANRGADQGNGQQLRDPNLIYPGLQVTIPGKSDTVTRTITHPAPRPTGPAPATHVAPETAAPRIAQPATGSDASTSARQATTSSAPTPSTAAAPASPSAAPDPLTGRAPVGAGSVIAPTPQPQPAPPQSVDQSVASEGDSTAVFRTVTGLGSIAAAGVLALLGLRRQRQTRTRRPGQRINLPTGQAAITEAHIRATADPLTVHDVDLALRTMAHNAVTAGMPIPGLRAARITTTAIELYLTDHTSRLPAPFAAEDDPGVWTLTRATAAGQLLDDTTAALTPAPYPTLVTIGHDEDDAHLLLNLEELRTLAITGENEYTHPVLAAIALELIASQWADAATITLVGVLPELADALGAGNVTYVEDLAQILASLEHTAHANADEMRAAGVDTPQQARADGMDADTWTPHLIITAEPPTADQRELVRDILHTSPRTSIAAVTQGAPLGEWQLHVTAPDQAELAPQQIPLTPQRLDATTLSQILDGFRAADEPHHDGPDWAGTIVDETPIEQVPDALPDHLEDTTAADANRQGDLEQKRAIALDPDRRGPDTDELEAIIDPEHDLTHLIDTIPTAVTTLPATGPVLRLLGPVRIDNPGGQEPQAPARSLKILAHMALAPGGHHPELDQAVWPTISVGTKLRAPAITMARKWIGTAPDGHDYLARHTANGGYRLAEDLPVDWRLFQQLIGPDISQASTQNLADALHLVYGIPLTNAQLGDDASIGYVSHENELISAIADVAHELATRYIQTGKPRAALWAAGKGLDTARGEEALWRDTLRAAHQMRDPDTVTQIIRAYTSYTAGLGCDLDPDTEHLITQITTSQPTPQHAHA